jgi:hypothetical protein
VSRYLRSTGASQAPRALRRGRRRRAPPDCGIVRNMKSSAKPKKVTKAVAKKPVVAKKAAAKKAVAKKPVVATKPAAKKPGPRADLGAPIDGFFVKQPPHLRPILESLRKLVKEAAPDAASSIKWGMPFFTVGGNMMCALAGFKSHVNLILSGPPNAFTDPEGFLEGDAKGGRHLKLRALEELPREKVRGWLRTAVALARAKK